MKLLILLSALTLKHGVYVRGDEPCADPPNAKITTTCRAAGDGSASSQTPADTFVMERQSSTRFLMLKDNVSYRWCSVKGLR